MEKSKKKAIKVEANKKGGITITTPDNKRYTALHLFEDLLSAVEKEGYLSIFEDENINVGDTYISCGYENDKDNGWIVRVDKVNNDLVEISYYGEGSGCLHKSDFLDLYDKVDYSACSIDIGTKVRWIERYGELLVPKSGHVVAAREVDDCLTFEYMIEPTSGGPDILKHEDKLYLTSDSLLKAMGI